MIPVIWQSDVAAVVMKPAGLATQSPPPHESLETQLREQFAAQSRYLALPHRLDRDVSGLILVAFTKKAARLLGEQFAAQRIAKSYLALVDGTTAEPFQTWSDWLAKVENEPRAIIVDEDSHGAKIATTRMTVRWSRNDRSLLELRPSTGRMHQLRIQAASRGLPMVGDTLYGSQTRLEIAGIALQASGIEFHHPATGQRIVVTAPDPSWATA